VSDRREKLINAVVFFTRLTKNCHKLKLFKLLNFLDFEHYRQTGRPSIGLRYEAWPMGPVPTDLDKELAAPGADIQSHVRIVQKRDDMTGKAIRFDFKPIKSFDPRYFTKREMRIMRELALYFDDLRADDMSEFSHVRGLPWREVYRGGVGKGHLIPYDLALKAQPLTDGETIDAEELAFRREALRGMADVT
jgi:uncharacterized phage-associated protein